MEDRWPAATTTSRVATATLPTPACVYWTPRARGLGPTAPSPAPLPLPPSVSKQDAHMAVARVAMARLGRARTAADSMAVEEDARAPLGCWVSCHWGKMESGVAGSL